MIEITLRIVFSLLVVLALMWGVAKVLRKPMAGRAAGTVSVLARQQLGRHAAVAVIKVTDRALVLGVTDHQVTLLAEADPATFEAEAAPPVRREPVQLPPTGSREPVAALAGVRNGAPAGGLAGSALSPQTWAQTVNFLRERTVRKP